MLTSKKGLSLLCVSVVVVVSVALVIAKNALEASSSEGQTPIAPEYFEKTGKIKRITFVYPVPGDCCTFPLTCVEFEDGEGLEFWDILKNFKEGRTYRIVYNKQDKIAYCDDNEFSSQIKTSTLNVVQVIEEISP
jgi:hypothetical protein